jgi:hypothetical protein
MKSVLKLVGIIAIMVVIGFSMTGCDGLFKTDDGSGDPGGDGTGSNENPWENAKTVTVGYSSPHTIASSGEHWFKFAGTGEPVIFETTGNVVDTYIAYDTSPGSYLWYGNDNNGEGYNALCSFTATSGTTYWIRITPRSGTSGTYTFVVTAPTFNIRTNPIAVTAGYSSSHVINSSGQHWFRFQGTGNSAVFETEGNVVNTSISIYIGDNTNTFLTHNNRISVTTISGTEYYVRITSNNSGTYIFKVRNGSGDGSSGYYAIPVMVGYSSSHTFNLSSDECWFSFMGTGNTVIFETEGNVVDTYIGYDTSPSYLWYGNDNSGEGYNARCSVNTTLGTTYFIRITARSGTSGTYTFVVRNP